jgi:hypothetical protein
MRKFIKQWKRGGTDTTLGKERILQLPITFQSQVWLDRDALGSVALHKEDAQTRSREQPNGHIWAPD